ncbi:ESPR-type extended signal peptide-containing protein, partial [Stenotrophomonas sp. C960]
MNRIYRRLWSRARQCWVVASELSRGRGKRGRARIPVVSIMALTALLPVMALAQTQADKVESTATESVDILLSEEAERAEDELEPGHWIQLGSKSLMPNAAGIYAGDDSYAAGTRAESNGEKSAAVGNRAKSHGRYSVALGGYAFADGDYSLAAGFGAHAAEGGYATAVGGNAAAVGVGATAYGHWARAYTENSIAMGSGATTAQGAGISRIAIGGDAYAGSSGWTGAIALGGDSRAEFDGVVIGYGAKNSATGAVALGSWSVANEANTVSVGSSSAKRRIVNVNDARLNSTSSDAVTGKQLYATNSNVTKAQTAADGAKTTAAAAQSTANTANTNANTALAKANAVSGLVSQVSSSGNVRLGGENTGTVLDVRNKSNAVRSITGLKDGALSTSSTEAVTGKQLNATNANVTTAQTAADAAKTTATA